MEEQAVIVIDVQNAILDKPNLPRRAETLADLDKVVDAIAQLLQWARRNAIPVLFVQHNGGKGDRLETGTYGWEIRKEIAPAEGEPIIPKTACDSFFETTLRTELEKRQVKKLIIAGCMTQYCIDTTTRRAVSLGYDVTLVSDGHTTADIGNLTHEQIIAHHNFTLNGFDAGEHIVSVRALKEVIS